MANKLSKLPVPAYLRSILLLAFFMGSYATTSYGQIWSENFNSYGDGTMNGPPKWTSYATDCDDSGQLNQGPGQSQWGVWAGAFAINDAEGAPCCPLFGGGGNDNGWLSQVIDISDYCNVSISMDVSASGVFECVSPGSPVNGCEDLISDNAQDQVIIEYSLDGGAWTQMAYICGDAGVGTITASGLNGSTLQIRFFAANKSNGEFYYIDNILVTGSTAPTPTFPPVGPLCENASPVNLPTNSNQGINGTWTPPVFDPSGLGGTTTTVEFTPASGQCATTAEMDIVVNNAVVPQPVPLGPFCETASSVPLPNIVSGVMGTWSGSGVSGFFFDPGSAVVGTNTLTFTPVAAACAVSNTLDIEVTAAATPDLDTDELCESDPSLNLNSLEDPSYTAGTWSGPGVTGDNFDPSGFSGDVVLTFTSSAQCTNPATTTITVNPLQTPNISGIPGALCELDAAIALPTNQSGIDGTWSGSGVSGNMFDPTGLNGSITLTFTPNASFCASTATTSIDVDAATTPTITGVPSNICELDASINLPSTQSGVDGNWSGSGVSGNSFDPTGLSGNVTLTFTPNSSFCANPATTVINVQQAITPTISGIQAAICELANAINLPTTQSGISGSWSGPGVSGDMFDPAGQSGSVTLTFTPDAGQCANNATTNINVNPPANLVLPNLPNSLCETAASLSLPPIVNGFAGTWSGQGVSGNTFDPSGLDGLVTLTFTPNTGLCANPASADIDIQTPTAPNITGVPNSLCESDAPISLPTNQGGIFGTWSGPGVSGNNFNPNSQNGMVTLTFTPNANQCATPATTDIDITPATTPIINGVPSNICELEPSIVLPTNQSGIDGTWSGQGVFNNNFDPTGLNGIINLTFTPNAGQCAVNAFEQINVDAAITPAITGVPNSICATASAINLPTTQNGITGDWSGAGVVNNSFSPVGLSGPIVLTFTPSTGFCAFSATTEINVGNGGAPNISGIPTSICQSALPINLPTIQDGLTGEWAGQGVMDNIFNPIGLNGNIVLTFTPDASFCAEQASFTIEVGNGGPPVITGVPQTICQSAQSIALPTTQGGITGVWSGQGVTGNTFSPAGLSGNITLTFTPDASFCAANATSIINVVNGGTPTITGVPSSMCQSEMAISLPTTQGGVTGTWSGQGVSNNSFDPAGLTGNITLTFTPAASFCAQSATAIVMVNIAATPSLGTTSLCESSGLFALSTLNDPNHPAGSWSGTGVTGGNFNPTGQSGSVTLTFTPSVNCVNTATTTITINTPIAPTLGTASICESDSPLSLASLANANFPNGTWSGPGVSGVSFDPNGQSGNVTLTFTSSANCTVASTTTVNVNSAPNFTNLDEPCEATNTTYTVSFTLGGGTTPYTIGGVAIVGNNFTSAPINSGDNYTFILDDAMGCGPVTISGTEDCNCTTDAGTMNIGPTPLKVCYNSSSFSALFNANEVLDGDDMLQFVLHDNPGASLGNILATSNTPNFPIPSGVVLGQTYYVSSVAGNGGANGVNLNDDCLSVSQGVPVQFYLPTLSIGPDATICAADCIEIPLNFSGNPNYLLDFSLDVNGVVQNDVLSDLPNSSMFEVCPSDYGLSNGTITFTVFGFVDQLNCAVDFAIPPINPPSTTITVGSAVVNNQNTTLCPGGSITVNGTVYDASNPSGSELLPGASFSGCDSVINVNLAFYPPATGTLNEGICPNESMTINGTVYNASHLTGTEILQGLALHGCDSILNVNLFLLTGPISNYNPVLCTGGSININGTVYDEDNPTGTEIFIGQAANGCDSTVIVNVTFNSTVTENIVQTLCADESIIVNGTVYDIDNPIGTETMPNGSILGCDSVANVNLSFYPPAVYNDNRILCTGGSVTINGTVYDETNPTGTEVIQDGSVHGCDSTIIVNLSFNSVVTNNINQTLCPDESIIVNQTIYDVDNPTGTELIPQGSYLGCDSSIIVNLNFYAPASSTYDDQLCFGGSVEINGTIYDESNPTGTEIFENVTEHGCDSTVFVNLSFGSSVIVSMDDMLCPGEVVFINGTMYSASNPTGTETFPLGSWQGCDSIININLSFYDEAVGYITEILQVGGFIVVNGTVYDEQNPSGIEVFTGASYHNCDSTVIINLSFIGGNAISAITQVNSPLCQFGSDGSIVVQGISGGMPPYIIALNGSNSSPVVNFPVIFDNLTFGFHTLTILDANGTVATQEIFMPDAPPFELDMGGQQTVSLGNSVTLNPTSTSQIVSWSWSPSDYLDCTDCAAPTSTPLKDILYNVAVTDINGCTTDGSVQIIVEKKQEVYVPNAFSPNNDGFNDELTIFASPQVESIVGFQIFSRWGEEVFAKYDFAPNDLQLGWDGTFKGQALDPAVFVWYAEIRFLDGQTRLFKGGVTLIR